MKFKPGQIVGYCGAAPFVISSIEGSYYIGRYLIPTFVGGNRLMAHDFKLSIANTDLTYELVWDNHPITKGCGAV